MEELDNLVKIKQLKSELPDQEEFEGMIEAAKIKLADITLEGLSKDSRFSLAYSAAHALALAALRWHGYRSESRYIVFQCLQHTIGLPSEEWRVFDLCHQRRNIAEYEGHLEIEDAVLNDLIRLTKALLTKVDSLNSNQNRKKT